jgi:hypothetical protein
MNASALVADLRTQGVSFAVRGDELLVYAPRGRITVAIREALVACKQDILRDLRERAPRAQPPNQPSSLADYAADRAPFVRFTLCETEDIVSDFRVLDAIRRVIQEFQPGGNHIFLNVRTVDGRRFKLEWRALVEPELRHALGSVLANEGLRRRSLQEGHDERVASTCR